MIDLPFSPVVTVIFAVLAVIVSVMTVAGNILVILSFVVERALRTPTNYFIASLAVTDILIGGFSMNFYTLYLLLGTWPLGEMFCDLWLSLDYTACLTSQYTVFFITVDRFCSVKIPAKYRNWRTPTKVLLMVAATWFIPSSIFFTTIIGWPYFTDRVRNVTECYAEFTMFPVFNTILTIGYYWITLIVMSGLYAGIYHVALDLQKKADAKRRQMSNAIANAKQPLNKHGDSHANRVSKGNAESNDDGEDEGSSCAMEESIQADIALVNKEAKSYPEAPHLPADKKDSKKHKFSIKFNKSSQSQGVTKTKNSTSRKQGEKSAKSTSNKNKETERSSSPMLPSDSDNAVVPVEPTIVITTVKERPSTKKSWLTRKKLNCETEHPLTTTKSSIHARIESPIIPVDSPYEENPFKGRNCFTRPEIDLTNKQGEFCDMSPIKKLSLANISLPDNLEGFQYLDKDSAYSCEEVKQLLLTNPNSEDKNMLTVKDSKVIASPVWKKREEEFILAYINSQRKTVSHNNISDMATNHMSETGNRITPGLGNNNAINSLSKNQVGNDRHSGISKDNSQQDELSHADTKSSSRLEQLRVHLRDFTDKLQIKRRIKEKVERGRTENRARKALRTITLIMGAFVLCWTPFHIFVLVKGFCDDSDLNYSCVNTHLYNISYWLCYMNSPINPFCYALANAQFKKTFLRILHLDFHRT